MAAANPGRKGLEKLAPTATILPSGWRTIADAPLNPGPKLLICLPSPENAGSRSPGAASAIAEKAKPTTSTTARKAALLRDLRVGGFMGPFLAVPAQRSPAGAPPHPGFLAACVAKTTQPPLTAREARI